MKDTKNLLNRLYNQYEEGQSSFIDTVIAIKKRLGDREVISFINLFRSRDFEDFFYPVSEKKIPISYPMYDVIDSILEGLKSKDETFFTKTISLLWKFYWELKRTISERGDYVRDYLRDYYIASLLELFNAIYENNLKMPGLKDKFESFVEKNKDVIIYFYYELRGTEHWGEKIYFLDDSDLFKQELLKRLKKYNFSIDFDFNETKINRDQLKEIIISNLKNQEFNIIFPNLKSLFKYEEEFFYSFKLTLGDFLEYIIDKEEAKAIRQIPLNRFTVSQDPLAGNIVFNENRHVINLSFNRLTSSSIDSFPESIINLHELVILDLCLNNINSISNSIEKLTKLEKLNLSRNKITIIPKSLCRLTQLKRLNMSQNKIRSIPESIKKLKKIKNLNLSGNELKMLPAGFGDLGNLKHVVLNDNEFRIFPKILFELDAIETIDLSNNPIKTLPEIGERSTRLRELWIKDCAIEKLPDSIGNLCSLKRLNIYNHNLDYIPLSILDLSLEYINISSKHVTSEKSQELLQSLESLTKKGTRIICEGSKIVPSLKASDLPYEDFEDDDDF